MWSRGQFQGRRRLGIFPRTGRKHRVCLVCNEKECQKKEEERKREREQKEEEEEDRDGEEEEGKDALQFIACEAVNYDILFSDEVLDAALQEHATSHGPHYVRVAEELLRLAHGRDEQHGKVFLNVKGDFLSSSLPASSLCHGKEILTSFFLTSLSLFNSSFHGREIQCGDL